MGAKHPSTLATITNNKAIKKVNNAFSTIQKIATYQTPIPPSPLPVSGGGISVGSGTTFPVLYPIAELGNNSGTITINLSNQNLHYQKMVINASGSSTIIFSGLLTNKAIVFTLDVTIGVMGVTAVNWPANLYNLPTLPITNGSRYVLYISGFKDGTEERYEVVGSSLTGSGGSTNWSSIIIDSANISKDMRQGTLSNLANITFDTGTYPNSLSISGIAGTGITYNAFGTDAHYFKIGGAEFMRISSASGILLDAPLDMSFNNIKNLDVLTFSVSTQTITGDSSGFTYALPTGTEAHIFKVGAAEFLRISTSTGILASSYLDMGGNQVKNLDTLTFNSVNQEIVGESFGLKYNVLTGQNHSFQVNFVEVFNVSGGNANVHGIFTVSGQSNLEGAVFFGGNVTPLADASYIIGSDSQRVSIVSTELLTNVNNIIFGPGVSSNRWIEHYTAGSGGLLYNVLSTENHSFQVNFVEYMSLQSGQLNMNGHIIPTVNITDNLGSQTLQWNNIHLGDNLNVYENGSTTAFLQINKHTSDHFAYHNVSDLFGHRFDINGTTVLGVEYDNTFGDQGYVAFWGAHVYTSATGGSATALPSNPVGYQIVFINGTKRKIPYYSV